MTIATPDLEVVPKQQIVTELRDRALVVRLRDAKIPAALNPSAALAGFSDEELSQYAVFPPDDQVDVAGIINDPGKQQVADATPALVEASKREQQADGS